MAKKKKQISKKTCSDCVHEFACQTWNVGNIHNMDAERCSNHETVKESPAYLVGLIDGRAEKKTNADRIRDMSDEELLNFMIKTIGNAVLCKTLGTEPKFCSLEWLQQPAEED